MPDRLQAGQALLRAVDAVERRKYRKILTGRLLEDGSVVLAGAPTNKCWVRYPYESREQTAVWGQVGGVNLPLYIGPSLDGGDEIKGIAWQTGTYTVGGALSTLAQAPHVGAVATGSISGLEFLPGRIEASTLGALNVHVNGFWYDTGYWDDGALIGNPALYDFDVSPYVTAPSGYSQWIPIYFDPDNAELLAVANTPVFGGVSVLSESAIDYSAIPAGMYFLGAVGIANGQTTIDGSSRFADMRFHIALKGLPLGWTLTHDVTLPAGHDFSVVGALRTGDYSLTVNGALWVL